MSLAIAPLAFANCTDNVSDVTAIATGTVFTAAANDVDSTAISLMTVAHDTHYLCIAFGSCNDSGADGQAYADILYDPAGGTSWSVLINDLACGFTPTVSATIPYACHYKFPLWIPSGSSIGIQAKTHDTIDITTGKITISALGNPNRPDQWWCGQGVETIGNTDSRGTSVTPGSSGAFGSWTSVGSTTTARYGSLQMGINGSDGTAAAKLYIWQAGIGSAQIPGTSNVYLELTTSEVGIRANQADWRVNIPSGTQLQARAGCSAGSPENIYTTFYGVY